MREITMPLRIPIGGKKKGPKEPIMLQGRKIVGNKLHTDATLKLLRDFCQIALPLLKRIEGPLGMPSFLTILPEEIYMSSHMHALVREQQTVVVEERDPRMEL
jgi:hypothetical protein